jgi:hypothetical protein
MKAQRKRRRGRREEERNREKYGIKFLRTKLRFRYHCEIPSLCTFYESSGSLEFIQNILSI